MVPTDGWNALGGGNLALVTNAHVIAGASKITYENSRGQEHAITGLLALDSEGDLVVLASAESKLVNVDDPLPLPELKLSERVPEIGERIYVIGNPHGLTQTFSDGLVSAIRNDSNEEVVQITAPISPGSSGGPVIDAKGEVVGVASFYIEGGENLNFAIASSRIRSLVSRVKLQPLSAALSDPTPEINNSAKIHGRDRVQIMGYEKSTTFLPNTIGVTIKNNESHNVGTVLFRITYIKDGAAPLLSRLAQLQASRQSLSLPLGNDYMYQALKDKVTCDKAYKRVLEIDPLSWTNADLADFPEFGTMISFAKDIVTHSTPDIPGYYEKLIVHVRAEIPTEVRKNEKDLADASAQLTSLEEARRLRTKELDEIAAEARRIGEELKSPPPSTPVD